VHPSKRATASEDSRRWAVVPASSWAPAVPFATANEARVALRAAGFTGPHGHGLATRWTR
jgi:hypothetical protein